MRFLRGRPSTTESTVALWAKSALNAVGFFAIFMAALPWVAHSLAPRALPLPDWLRIWGGGALSAVGLALWIACLDAFSRQGRGTPLPTDAPQRLVTGGLFGVIRNPLIAGEMMVIWGVALHVGSLGIVVYACLMLAFAQWVVTRIEEPELRERFGESYEEYCRNVPRWIPGRRRTR